MTAQRIDRSTLKAQTRSLLGSAQVNPRRFTALYLLLLLVLDQLPALTTSAPRPVALFLSILVKLMAFVLGAGFTLYCMAVRRGQRAEYLTLFDGFSFVGKIVGLVLLQTLFIYFWSMLFLFPGLIAAYRYRFALLNLCENPGITAMEALALSKRQTFGYKWQLFQLDLSYLGWGVLSLLPNLLLIHRVAQEHLTPELDPFTAAAVLNDALTQIPWGVFLALALFSLVIRLFYLPNYRCTELGYYEIAKQTSNVRPVMPDAPDQLGGWS